MRKSSIFIVLFIANLIAFAQYDKPYRITYQDANKSLLILNRGNGTVIEMDSNYKTKTVITGLKDPRDIQFASFGTNQGILIIDDNQLKIFDPSSYSSFVNFSISKSIDAESVAFDLKNPGKFYVADLAGSKIIEGTVGPAPFYVPTFKVLADTGIHRPRGMFFDSNSKLLLVSDTLNSPIQEINLTNGSSKILMQTGLDSCHSLTQDLEGNFYLTNWDDSYIYRIDPSFKTKKRIVAFNNPSGMYFHADLDLLITCCTNCNKIEFQKLHWFEPLSDLRSCEGDSIQMSLSPQFNGIGTFLSGNRFIVQMSDSAGSFLNWTNLGYAEADTNPSKIALFLPSKSSFSSIPGKHKYRIRSTKPAHFSQEKSITPFKTPRALAYGEDSIGLCIDSKLQLGSTGEKGVSYTWVPSSNLNDTQISNPVFVSKRSGNYSYKFKAASSMGCADSSSVHIQVNADIRLTNFERKYEACLGDTVKIGLNSSPYKFKWSPKVDIDNDSIPNPTWVAKKDVKYRIQLIDLQTGCSGKDSVELKVSPLPDIDYIQTQYETCAGDSINIGSDRKRHPDFLWVPFSSLGGPNPQNPIFSSRNWGEFRYQVTVKDSNSCEESKYVFVSNRKRPSIPAFSVIRPAPDTIEINVMPLNELDSVQLLVSTERNGPYSSYRYVSAGEKRLVVDPIWKYFLLYGQDSFQCDASGDTVMSLFTGSIKQSENLGLYIYPNPSKGLIHVQKSSESEIRGVYIHDLMGRSWPLKYSNLNGDTLTINLRSFKEGIYFIEIQSDFGRFRQKFRLD